MACLLQGQTFADGEVYEADTLAQASTLFPPGRRAGTASSATLTTDSAISQPLTTYVHPSHSTLTVKECENFMLGKTDSSTTNANMTDRSAYRAVSRSNLRQLPTATGHDISKMTDSSRIERGQGPVFLDCASRASESVKKGRVPISDNDYATFGQTDEVLTGVATAQPLYRGRVRVIGSSKKATQMPPRTIRRTRPSSPAYSSMLGSERLNKTRVKGSLPPSTTIASDLACTGRQPSRHQLLSADRSTLGQTAAVSRIRTRDMSSYEPRRSCGIASEGASPISVPERKDRAASMGSISGNPGSMQFAQQLRHAGTTTTSSNGVRLACTGPFHAAKEAGFNLVKNLTKVF